MSNRMSMGEPPAELEVRRERPALEVAPPTAPVDLEIVTDAETIVARSEKTAEIVRRVMKSGTHYGPAYPGARGDPILYQAGVNTLNRAFGLTPRCHFESQERREDFIAYVVRCQLELPDGRVVADGLGAANSREEKYRYRVEYLKDPVPKEVVAPEGSRLSAGGLCREEAREGLGPCAPHRDQPVGPRQHACEDGLEAREGRGDGERACGKRDPPRGARLEAPA